MLAAVMMAAATSVSWSRPSQVQIKAFRTADTNKDRLLSMSEFRAFVRLMAVAGNRKARLIRFFFAYGYAFGIVDQDRNGQASPAELIKADAENSP